ncbi:MAG: Gfo/Idh/MocA family oxidoreductase [Tabrizicola sp.]|uniref:Gfo/Idh/MocA family protein n=1 Tax=Tabrizicola sp. TaxID=2005166 RepID=UPI002735468A|nr:Gfo/Idh/MocA family oxidoreductase [Tabrizicola sp.]MDP3263900.1 Gfo/Idh/MocA family oxidoreductase [Tabrizicola sp.]MDP3647264.1 Gfo/Idh/MocA family oxidoreductase [Paracoccaceae bacterium]MDZ4068599.1 Gfo/Idh/MocA family oxidoreductase [Tabrizicola sp.]
MANLGIGIIGCGNISTSYLRLAPLFKGLEVRAVADMNMDAAKARAEEFNTTAQSVDDLLANPAVDVVINLTIPDAHYAVTRRILEAGKHAYSEKPLVLTLDEGETLRALAKSKGLSVGCAPDTFLGGAHQQARAVLDEGRIGTITAGCAAVLNHGMEHWHPNPDFFFLPGAGPMLDLGPYYVANLINFLGPVKRVGALTSSAMPERTISNGPRTGETVPVKTPTNIHALLEFHNGATITLSTSWDVWHHKRNHFELYGTEGTLYVPDPNFFGGTVEIGGKDGSLTTLDPWDHPFCKVNQVHNGRELANYRTAGLADMVAALQGGRDARCSLERTLHGVEVMTACLKSGETGGFVTLTTTCTRPAALSPDEARALLV